MSSPLADKLKLSEAINYSTSIKEVLTYLNLKPSGGNYYQAKIYADRFGLALPSGLGLNQTMAANLARTVPDNEVFVENSKASRGSLKRRLRGIWSNWICAECGQGEIWNGKAISLQLDHINGVNNDSRLENLRLLCPNCHSQTDTFAGRNLKNASSVKVLIECACGKLTKTGKCTKCCNKAQGRAKIDWPSKENLLDRLKLSNYTKLGRELGVSDNAIRKYLYK